MCAPHISFNCFLFKSLFVALGFKINPVCPAFAFCMLLHYSYNNWLSFSSSASPGQRPWCVQYTLRLVCLCFSYCFFLIVNLEEVKSVFYSLFISNSHSEALQFNYIIQYHVFIYNIGSEIQTDPPLKYVRNVIVHGLLVFGNHNHKLK